MAFETCMVMQVKGSFILCYVELDMTAEKACAKCSKMSNKQKSRYHLVLCDEKPTHRSKQKARDTIDAFIYSYSIAFSRDLWNARPSTIHCVIAVQTCDSHLARALLHRISDVSCHAPRHCLHTAPPRGSLWASVL